MIKEAIETVVSGDSLSFQQAAGVMDEIMSGEATPAQIGALVTALRIKGETVEEIAGLASVMRDKAVPVKARPPVIDTCGTGGDNCASINISTAAAFVAAGAGLNVAKHGNRAMTSHCGSADVLEALGVKIELGAEAVAECLEKVGMGFMFAPIFHPAMKYAAGPRREIGIRTVFNILGPLTNPARAEFQVIGVPSEALGAKIAAVLQRLGTKHSLVVHGRNGLDEVSSNGPTLIWEIDEARVAPPYEVSPEYFGFGEAALAKIKGGSPEENADILRRVLGGERGPWRGNKASDLKAGARLAEEVIDSGRGREKMEALIRISQSLG
jgi:anthranilate phosphoribosyltransferase